jgi:hypothetical protein
MVRAMTASGSWYSPVLELLLYIGIKLKSFQRAVIPQLQQATLCITPTRTGILSTESTQLVKPGAMLPDPRYPVFPLAASPAEGSLHLFPLLTDSFKHVALFFIAGHELNEPHPLFDKFVALCEPYSESLRPAIMARTYAVGGFRKPNWAAEDKNIIFLSTNSSSTEKIYGLNGKEQLGILIIRPDGYVAFSSLIDESGSEFKKVDNYLSTILVKH